MYANDIPVPQLLMKLLNSTLASTYLLYAQHEPMTIL